MKVDVFNGSEWIERDSEMYNGVDNIENIESIYGVGEEIRVEYKSGIRVVYKNVFGTYVAQYQI